MSDAGGTEETTDYAKLKVNDLKKILKNRGLSLAGNKQELIDRLQSAEITSEDLLDGSEVGDEVGDEDLERELDESTLLIGDEMDKTDTKEVTNEKVEQETKEEPESTSPAKIAVVNDTPKEIEENDASNGVTDEAEVPNTTQQKRKISLKSETATPNDAAKKKLRAERFGAGGDSKDLLAKRAERFAINSTTTSTAGPDKSKVPQGEALKKRAERFGILSPAEQKKQLLEKMQARKLRFSSSGSSDPSPPDPTSTTTATATIAAVPALPSGVKPMQLSVEERKKLRAQRFNPSK